MVTAPGPAGVEVAFLAEFAITFVLMLVVLTVSNSRFGRFTGFVVGAMVATYITVEAPLSGMSMNPARSFASAAVSGIWIHLWVYFVAPPLGMLSAAQVFVWLKGRFAVRCAKMDHDHRVRCIFCEHHARQTMWRKAVWLIPVGVIVAFLLVRSSDRGFTMPETFPSLDDAGAEIDAVPPPGGTELATFGSGCFWCTDAVFQQIMGVTKVVSGYSGGSVPNPTYGQICTGTTGHAEVVQVTFDPTVVTYPELLEVFWRSHDPTTRDRQGHDTGPQYRSVVFTHSDRQRQQAERYKQMIDAAKVYPNPLVTEIVPITAFYPAEADHQNYFASNPRQPYCRAVIGPKVEKLRAVFRDKLKTD